MRVSLCLALLASLAAGTGADPTKDVAKAAMGTLHHLSSSPTKDAKTFMHHAGLGGENGKKNEGGSSAGSQKVKKKEKKPRSLSYDDDDDDWDDDTDDDWYDQKEHLPSIWGTGPTVVVAITLIGALLVCFGTWMKSCSICPACCYKCCCCTGTSLKCFSILFFLCAVLMVFAETYGWASMWYHYGMSGIGIMTVLSCFQYFFATAMCAAGCSEDRDMVAGRKDSTCCRLCPSFIYRCCSGMNLKLFTIVFMISTFLCTMALFNEGFKIDEDGFEGFVYNMGWQASIFTFVLMVTVSYCCIISMNAPFWNANAEEESSPEFTGCKLCCKLPKTEGCTGTSLKAKAWYLFLLAFCFSFVVAHSAGIVPGLLFDCILERHGFKGCTDSWGQTNDDDDGYDSNSSYDDDDNQGGNVPSVQIFLLPIFFCVFACCCWTGAAALCTAACTEERKTAQGILDAFDEEAAVAPVVLVEPVSPGPKKNKKPTSSGNNKGSGRKGNRPISQV